MLHFRKPHANLSRLVVVLSDHKTAAANQRFTIYRSGQIGFGKKNPLLDEEDNNKAFALLLMIPVVETFDVGQNVSFAINFSGSPMI